ncbi:MAG: DUF167 domain-containing protein [Dehalococcoidia bacterium]
MAATLQIRVVPRASRSEIIGLSEGVLRVRIAKPPTEGKANQALISLLAATMGVRPRDIWIIRGANARNKLVRIEGIEQEEAMARLGHPG